MDRLAMRKMDMNKWIVCTCLVVWVGADALAGSTKTDVYKTVGDRKLEIYLDFPPMDGRRKMLGPPSSSFLAADGTRGVRTSFLNRRNILHRAESLLPAPTTGSNPATA
jgi:hypothetical protein